MKETASLILLLLFVASPVPGQEKSVPAGSGIVILAGGGYSRFFGSEDFTNFYPSAVSSYTTMAGVGNGEVFALLSYQQIDTHGSSKVTNTTALGRAAWQQRILHFGLRHKFLPTPLYYGLSFFLTDASETITTVSPSIPGLRTTHLAKDRGIGISIGLNPELVESHGLFIEASYLYTLETGTTQHGAEIPSIGGSMVSAGLLFTI